MMDSDDKSPEQIKQEEKQKLLDTFCPDKRKHEFTIMRGFGMIFGFPSWKCMNCGHIVKST